MRIAQVAPLSVSVPPTTYGGTERVVHAITYELHRRGHEAVLFAAGTSDAPGELVATSPLPLWEMPATVDQFAYRVLQIEEVVRRSGEFDVIHWHVEWMPFLAGPRLQAPTLTTLHGNLATPGRRELIEAFPGQALVSISDAQRQPLDGLDVNWVSTVYHGDRYGEIYHYGEGKGGYLAFLGRFSPHKGPQTAINVALRAGVPIKLAARLDPMDKAFFDRDVRPLLEHPLVEWVGELDDGGKAKFLADARALILPITWDEPFGLVFPEALAAGTPVITRPRGSTPEIIEHGKHGFLVSDEDDMVRAVRFLEEIDRRECRRYALERFSVERMVDDYELAYRNVMCQFALAHAPDPLTRVAQYGPSARLACVFDGRQRAGRMSRALREGDRR